MKKLLLCAFALSAIGFTSCKKDWKCTCTDADGEVFEYDIKNSRRPEASLACSAYETLAEENCSLN